MSDYINLLSVTSEGYWYAADGKPLPSCSIARVSDEVRRYPLRIVSSALSGHADYRFRREKADLQVVVDVIGGVQTINV